MSEILAVPSQLLETAPVYTSKANSVTTFGSEVDVATMALLSVLEGSGLPLGSFLDATTILIDKTQISFECAERNLKSMAQALATTAQEFSSTDAQLAALFSALDAVIPEFAGYERMPLAVPGQTLPAELMPQLPPKPQPHRGFWGSIGHGLATAWDDTGGKAVSFIGHHWQYFAAGVVVVGSVGLDIVTAGAATSLTPEEADAAGALVASGVASDAAGAAATSSSVASSSAMLSGATGTGADIAAYDPAIEAEMAQIEAEMAQSGVGG